MTSTSLTVKMTGPAALRALARAFAHLGDFSRFVQGLQHSLDRSEHFERIQLSVDRELADGAAHFSPGALTLPVSNGELRFGTLQVAPGGDYRQFGAEDIHLMSALADFLGAALGQSLRLQDAEHSRELFRFLLNQAPVGIAAYSADHRPLVANDQAARWIGEAGLPFEEFEAGVTSFHLRAGGKLIYGEARRPDQAGAGAWMIVLHDLTPEQVKLLELMKRETYRTLAEGGRLGFALIESAQLRDGVLRRLPELRAALHDGEVTGPYDAHRVGVVLGGLSGVALRARLRQLRTVFGSASGLRIGYAELGRDGRTPEAILATALQRYGAYDEMLRPAVLVQDENPAVAATLAMVLSKDYRVVQSSEARRTRELLAAESFEGLVTELEPRNGPRGVELVREATALQPGIRPFLTTLHRDAEPPADVILIEKPFDVGQLTATVHARLAEPVK